MRKAESIRVRLDARTKTQLESLVTGKRSLSDIVRQMIKNELKRNIDAR